MYQQLLYAGNKLTEHRRVDGAASQRVDSSANVQSQTNASRLRLRPWTYRLCTGILLFVCLSILFSK